MNWPLILVMSMCLLVCLSVRISPEPHVQSLPNFLCMLPMFVAWSSSDVFTIGCINLCCIWQCHKVVSKRLYSRNQYWFMSSSCTQCLFCVKLQIEIPTCLVLAWKSSIVRVIELHQRHHYCKTAGIRWKTTTMGRKFLGCIAVFCM